jgi:hypothetical protein
MKHYCIFGVDPGLKGGIAVLKVDAKTHKVLDEEVYPMPSFDKVFTTVSALTDFGLGATEWICCIEDVAAIPGWGVRTYKPLFRSWGWAEAAIAYCTDAKFIYTRPKQWKKEMGLSKDKEEAITMSQKLFPYADLIPSRRARKPSDGMAEALLIAEHTRRGIENESRKANTTS